MHPVGRHALESEALALRERPVLLPHGRRDGALLSELGGGHAPHARDRRALYGRDGPGSNPPALLPDARRARRLRVPRRAVRARSAVALRARDAGAARAARVRAEDDPGDGVRGLLPDRLRLRRVREAKRNRRRPGSRAPPPALSSRTASTSPTSTHSRYELLFERFLNPGRKSMPDIDIDFSVHRRERGDSTTSPRSTAAITSPRSSPSGRWPRRPRSGTPDGPSSIRYGDVDRVAKLIPEGPRHLPRRLLKPVPSCQAYDGDEACASWSTPPERSRASYRQGSIHAAGVVIANVR